ncbi:MAG TPA: hypothetical protein VER08_01325 [Pyrinomonadaceae bacterium]|nr:hypothetical protein [Pyrinomonadaceae bacterium]
MNGRVIAAVDDLFFASKIRGTAEQAGVSVEFPRGADALAASAGGKDVPGLFVFDLHAARFGDLYALAARLKQDERLRGVPLVGFFSHVHTELQRRALDAGFDRVLPRSAFTKRLPEILRGEL